MLLHKFDQKYDKCSSRSTAALYVGWQSYWQRMANCTQKLVQQRCLLPLIGPALLLNMSYMYLNMSYMYLNTVAPTMVQLFARRRLHFTSGAFLLYTSVKSLKHIYYGTLLYYEIFHCQLRTYCLSEWGLTRGKQCPR